LDPGQLDELIDQARRQIEMLDRFHAYARGRAFREGLPLGADDVGR
jgi:UDP-glucose 4-epimerase